MVNVHHYDPAALWVTLVEREAFVPPSNLIDIILISLVITEVLLTLHFFFQIKYI